MQEGFSAVFMHLRGCGREPNQLARSHHSSASEVLERLERRGKSIAHLHRSPDRGCLIVLSRFTLLPGTQVRGWRAHLEKKSTDCWPTLPVSIASSYGHR
jgi:hypothetical protein